MGLGVGVRVRWFQLPRRRGQGQRGRTGIRVPGGALFSAREPAPGVGSRRGTSRERPGRLSPGRVERLGSLGGSMAQEAGKGFGKPKPWGQRAPLGKTTAGALTSGERRTHSRETGHSTGGTVRGQLREDGHAGSGAPASPGAHGHAGRLTHSGCRDLGSRTNRRQREVGRTVGGAGVTVTTATTGGRRHRLGRSGLDHLSGRGPHRPGLLGLQGQLVGHLERLAQRQDDLIGQVLGGGRAQGERREQGTPPWRPPTPQDPTQAGQQQCRQRLP